MSKTWKRFGLVTLAATLAATLASSAGAQLAMVPCHRPGLAEEVRCGTFEPWEDPEADSPRRLALDLVVVPALAPDPAPDPVFVLAGGPGQAATEMVAPMARMLSKVRKTRDLVFLDQRGTGRSGLECPIGDPLDAMSASAGDGADGNPMAECRDRLSVDADLTRYTTFHFVPDLDAVRRALGYERINLWGGSYGSRAALVYQDRYPEHTRAVVLDGLAPFELRLPLYNPREAQRALDRLFADCAADPSCAERFPDPAGDLADLLAALEAEPRTLSAPHPLTGELLELRLHRQAAAGIVRTALYSAEQAAKLPMVLHEAASGRFGPLLSLGLQGAQGTVQTLSLGLTFSVLCSEDQTRIDTQEAHAVAEGTFLGSAEFDGWAHTCELWPKADLPAGFDRLEPRDTPALLLSGELDPVVPPEWSEPTRRVLPRSRHVVVPGTGHIVSGTGCVPRLIADFLADPDPDALDVSCVESVERPPFVVGFYGPEP